MWLAMCRLSEGGERREDARKTESKEGSLHLPMDGEDRQRKEGGGTEEGKKSPTERYAKYLSTSRRNNRVSTEEYNVRWGPAERSQEPSDREAEYVAETGDERRKDPKELSQSNE